MVVQLDLPLGTILKPLKRLASEAVLEVKDGQVLAKVLSADQTMLAIVKAGIALDMPNTSLAVSMDDIVSLNKQLAELEFNETEVKVRYETKRGVKVSKKIKAMAPSIPELSIAFEPIAKAVIANKAIEEAVNEVDGDTLNLNLGPEGITVAGSDVIRDSTAQVPANEVSGQGNTRVSKNLIEPALKACGYVSNTAILEVNEGGLLRLSDNAGLVQIYIAPMVEEA